MHVFEEKDDRFYIGWSSIENAGRGVFAARPIKAGELLLITGVLVERNSESDRTTVFLNRYKFVALPKIKDKKILDYGKYSICPLGYAALVNHTGNRKLQNVEIRYLDNDEHPYEHGDRAVYYFIKDVNKGEEILGNYGNHKIGFKDNTLNSNKKVFRPILGIKAIGDV